MIMYCNVILTRYWVNLVRNFKLRGPLVGVLMGSLIKCLLNLFIRCGIRVNFQIRNGFSKGLFFHGNFKHLSYMDNMLDYENYGNRFSYINAYFLTYPMWDYKANSQIRTEFSKGMFFHGTFKHFSYMENA